MATKQALYLNGVFESVLKEIIAAQAKKSGAMCYLQPYSPRRIQFLEESHPDESSPASLFISLTDSLSVVSYRARIVGWQDKRTLHPDDLKLLNEHVRKFQPDEKEIYLTTGHGQPCVNLIAVTDVEQLVSPIPVSTFIKTSDNLPLKARKRAGGWAYVHEPPEWLGTEQTVVAEQLEEDFRRDVAKSMELSSAARQARLEKAPQIPQSIQVVAHAFRRNADVVAEVLYRAKGKWEKCKSDAPFLRKSDGTPYLEIHHRVTLASGGPDTVDNAIALCPNCHRNFHYGV